MWGNVAISHEGVCALAFGMNIADAAIENSSIRVIAIAEVLSFRIFLYFSLIIIHFCVQCVISIQVIYKILQSTREFLFDFILYTNFVILDKL
jgi:hypothetical protein